MEILEIVPNQTITFICYDINDNQIFKANFDYLNKTYTVLEIYPYRNNTINKYLSPSVDYWGCNLTMGAAGLLWSTAFGMVTAGAGFIVGAGWLVLQTWICS